jgi:uncharacterized protein (TIGR02246 family)
MRKVHKLTTAAAIVAVMGAGFIYSQSDAGAAGTLSGADIAEIQQLYARYNQGLDFKDKELFLSAFAADAVYTTGGGEVHEGTAGITEWVTPLLENNGGPAVTHNNTSILITPTAEGAKGRGYWTLMNVAERQPTPVFSGYYVDTYVKTADGWRIKTRGSVRGWPQDSQ